MSEKNGYKISVSLVRKEEENQNVWLGYLLVSVNGVGLCESVFSNHVRYVGKPFLFI